MRDDGQMSDHNSQVLDRFLMLPDITVTMKDGSSLRVEDFGSGATEDLGDGTRVEKAVYFDRIIDVDQVASVTLCGVEIPVA